MRKMKKINGYLVVKFNDRELREWAGTALGNFGVIDAELYTGQIEIDRSVMEYDSAETIEEAVEQARGLEAELDVEEPAVTVTVIKETDEKTIEKEPIDPAELFKQEKQFIERQIKSRHYPLVNEMTGAHMLHGFSNALKRLDIIDDTDEDFLVFPETFSHERETFEHLPEEKQGGTTRAVYALGLKLSGDCPQNDCRLYLNTFNMCREIDEQLDRLQGFPREHLVGELTKLYIQLEKMFVMNYAVKQFRKSISEQLPIEPPDKQTAPEKYTTLSADARQEIKDFVEYEQKLTDSLAAAHGWFALEPQPSPPTILKEQLKGLSFMTLLSDWYEVNRGSLAQMKILFNAFLGQESKKLDAYASSAPPTPISREWYEEQNQKFAREADNRLKDFFSPPSLR